MQPTIIWLTGSPCSGKTSIAEELHRELGDISCVFDGDVIRQTISRDLKPGPQDREKNLMRVIDLINQTKDRYAVSIAAIVSPIERLRQLAKSTFETLGFNFMLVHVTASKKALIERDVKGLYKKAIDGDKSILLPGFNDIYEIPQEANVTCFTDKESLKECVDKIKTAYLKFAKQPRV